MTNFLIFITIILSFVFVDKEERILLIKNEKVIENKQDFGFDKDDKLKIKISNSNNKIKFRIDSVELIIIPSKSFQEIKRQERYWKKYAKIKILKANKYEQEPVLNLDFYSIYNKECTRMIVKILGISEIDERGKLIPLSSKFLMGKEYELWNTSKQTSLE